MAAAATSTATSSYARGLDRIRAGCKLARVEAPPDLSRPSPAVNGAISLVPPYVSAQPLARWLAVLLVVTGLVAWIAVGFDIADIRLLARQAGGEAIEAIDRRAHGITGAVLLTAQITLFVVTALAFVLWTYAARSNLRALGARRLDYTTAWSVAGWWVPGLNVVRPYQVLREIWKASDPTTTDRFAWKQARTPALLILWWVSFVGFVALDVATALMTLSAGVELPKFQYARAASVLADTGAAVSASLAYFVVTKITDAQHEKWELREQYQAIDDDLLVLTAERATP